MSDAIANPPSKPLLKSKTAWVMALAFLAGFVPQAQEWLEENPVTVLQALAAIGLLLRFVTSGRLTIFSDDDGESSTGAGVSGGGGRRAVRDGSAAHDETVTQRRSMFPWLVMMACAAMLLTLPGCGVVASAITGIPQPATAVQRAGHDGAQPILISSADLAAAEAQAAAAYEAGEPAAIHGLYDAGRAAAVAREVFTESSK